MIIFLEKVCLLHSSLVLCTERPRLSLSKLLLEPGIVQFICAQESDLQQAFIVVASIIIRLCHFWCLSWIQCLCIALSYHVYMPVDTTRTNRLREHVVLRPSKFQVSWEDLLR